MSLIIKSFEDKSICYSLICKNTDKFNKLEDKIYGMKDFEKYVDFETCFMTNGIKINKHKTLEDNKIKDNDVIFIKKNK